MQEHDPESESTGRVAVALGPSAFCPLNEVFHTSFRFCGQELIKAFKIASLKPICIVAACVRDAAMPVQVQGQLQKPCRAAGV